MNATPLTLSELPTLPERFGNPVLRGFHEIVPGADINWLPQSPGWYGLGLIVIFLTLRSSWRRLRHWRRNRYRRQAVARLEHIANQQPLDPAALNALLKITAMVASSREEVATLTGDAWVDWLSNRQQAPLSDVTRHWLAHALYVTDTTVDASARQTLLEDARLWLLTHRDDHAAT